MTTLEICKRIYSLTPPARHWQMVLLLTGMIFCGLSELVYAGMISLLGVAMASPGSITALPLMGRMFETLPAMPGTPETIRVLICVLFLLFCAVLLKNLMMGAVTYYQCVVSQTAAWDVASSIFRRYLYASYAQIAQRNIADMMTRLQWRSTAAMYMQNICILISQAAIIALLLGGALVLTPLMSAFLYGVIGLASFVLFRHTRIKAFESGNRVHTYERQSNEIVVAALNGMREVQVYRREEAFQQDYKGIASGSVPSRSMQLFYPSLPQWVLESTGIALLLLIVLILSHSGSSIATVTGILTLMAGISLRLLPAATKLVNSVMQLEAMHAQVEALVQEGDLDMRPEQGNSVLFQKQLELRQVCYTYPDAVAPALAHIDMTIPHGSMIGVIGPSGAGKSTLIGTLTGLLKPQSGVILCDGKPLAPMDFLRIGYVPQHPYILDAPLAQNVAFSQWGMPPDEERVCRCCRMAAVDFLDSLPNGIHTILGERGARLSGGQMQRVSIARALYSAPDILLFDEATSALDTETEKAVQQTILGLKNTLTVIIIAHRLSTVEACDTLFRLEGGTIVTSGSPEQVLTKR